MLILYSIILNILKPINERAGRFIVIYGPNNLGKSTQISNLANRLLTVSNKVVKYKYALYDLEPTGPLINNYLRHPELLDREYTVSEMQSVWAQNRRDFQNTLVELLNYGFHVVVEDYLGTSIAWGMTFGVDRSVLEKYNSDLIIPDISINLDGERFTGSIERGHRHEDTVEDIWDKNRKIHLQLAKDYGWKLINANQTVDKVGQDIWNLVEPMIPIVDGRPSKRIDIYQKVLFKDEK